MKNVQKTLAAAIVSTVVLSPAYAQESGPYVTVNGGVELQSGGDFIGIQAPVAGAAGVAGAPANVEVDFDTGFNIRGAVGYEFKKGFISFLKPSVEVEVGYSENDISSGAFNGGDQSFSGDTSLLTIQLNYNNDIIFSKNQKVTPYIGGGIGIGIVDANILYFPNNGVATAPIVGVFGSSTNFSSNNRIGLKTKLSDGFDIFAEGRYTRVSSGDFERVFLSNAPAPGFNADVSGDTDTFSLGIGLRARF